MSRGRNRRGNIGAAVALAIASAGITVVATSTASTASADCGVHLLPSLDPSGEHPRGEILDLTPDGVYIGASEDADGRQQATYWINSVPRQVPVELDDGSLLDVNNAHVAVGDGYDPGLDRWRGYVFDIDTGAVTWLPGIGGFWASARRLNEHGVAVGDGGSTNGTAHPLRWRPPYTQAERLPKIGGDRNGAAAWAAGINDHGDIVGSTSRGRLTPDKRDYGGVPAQYHWTNLDAISWQPSPHALQEAGPSSHTWSVNNDGRAVGYADVDALQSTLAAYWSIHDGRLHLMGSPVPDSLWSYALGVSAGGWATGAVETEGTDRSVRHAFVWTGSGELLMMPGLAGPWRLNESNTHGVDDNRDEVTGKLVVDGISRPTVWRCASQIGDAAHTQS